MKPILFATTLAMACATAFAQPQKPTYAYFEGMNLSMGIAQNATQASTDTATVKATTSVSVAKVNYTFALAYPAKLGVSATLDLKNSKVSDSENLAISSPTEVSVEPGILLLSNSLLYAKLGTYASRYESGANATRNLNGINYGVGIKHYLYGQNFIQLEWTQRNANDNPAGLAGVKFKQSSAAALVGFNF